MPRQARKKSETGIYHVMVRGINRQILFEADEDRKKFLDVIKQYKEIGGYKVHGYCLMDNHVHLILQEGQEGLDVSLKRIGVCYVYWYNRKYNRTGHLFQDRFKSEPIENDEYLSMVIKYVHQNPVAADMVAEAGAYRWSSYREYMGQAGVTDTALVQSMFGDDREKMRQFFLEVTGESNILDIQNARLTDREAGKLIKKLSDEISLHELAGLEKAQRDDILRRLKQQAGLSVRQIARITGITINVVAKA